jgi:putative aminopeptidase FrvX
MISRRYLPLAVAFFLPAAVSAQTLQDRFVGLADAQGVSGYEADVRAAVRAQLPEWAASMARVDEIGNLIVTVGSGEPRTILVPRTSTRAARLRFAWSVEEEVGLLGAEALAPRLEAACAFGVDTFVTSDAPLPIEHLAHAELGKGAVLRVLNGSTPSSLMSHRRAGQGWRRAAAARRDAGGLRFIRVQPVGFDRRGTFLAGTLLPLTG